MARSTVGRGEAQDVPLPACLDQYLPLIDAQPWPL